MAGQFMKAVRVNTLGDSSVLSVESTPIVAPKTGEILVQVKAAGINYIDTYFRSGLYPVDLPMTLGKEGAGVVTAVGDGVDRVSVGDRVAFACSKTSGTYAEYATVLANEAVALPGSLDFTPAAALMLQGMTAHYLTHSTYEIKKGDTVLVHAAAGGTGGLVCQMAKLRGAQVIGTASTEEKMAIARKNGCDIVVPYADAEEAVKKATDGKLCHAVYDGVGASTWDTSLSCVRRRGYMVSFGNASGAVPPVTPLSLMKQGSIYMTRPTMFDYISEPEEFAWRSSEVLKWMSEGKISLQYTEFPLDDVKKAHDLLEGRGTTGKLVLVPKED